MCASQPAKRFASPLMMGQMGQGAPQLFPSGPAPGAVPPVPREMRPTPPEIPLEGDAGPLKSGGDGDPIQNRVREMWKEVFRRRGGGFVGY